MFWMRAALHRRHPVEAVEGVHDHRHHAEHVADHDLRRVAQAQRMISSG